jgi:hypothetical protein
MASLSQQGRRQVMMALGNFQAREKRAGRPPAHSTLQRIQRELEQTILRQEGKA